VNVEGEVRKAPGGTLVGAALLWPKPTVLRETLLPYVWLLCLVVRVGRAPLKDLLKKNKKDQLQRKRFIKTSHKQITEVTLQSSTPLLSSQQELDMVFKKVKNVLYSLSINDLL
jgi:hypothetical protein